MPKSNYNFDIYFIVDTSDSTKNYNRTLNRLLRQLTVRIKRMNNLQKHNIYINLFTFNEFFIPKNNILVNHIPLKDFSAFGINIKPSSHIGQPISALRAAISSAFMHQGEWTAKHEKFSKPYIFLFTDGNFRFCNEKSVNKLNVINTDLNKSLEREFNSLAQELKAYERENLVELTICAFNTESKPANMATLRNLTDKADTNLINISSRGYSAYITQITSALN